MLTDRQVKKAKLAERDYKITDSAGLYLYVTRKGAKSWRLKYRFADREKRLVFPSQRHVHRPMSENAIGYLYNRVGFHGRHVPHGWRASFSTIMNEVAERSAQRARERPAHSCRA